MVMLTVTLLVLTGSMIFTAPMTCPNTRRIPLLLLVWPVDSQVLTRSMGSGIWSWSVRQWLSLLLLSALACPKLEPTQTQSGGVTF
jgi:hypothetical protein